MFDKVDEKSPPSIWRLVAASAKPIVVMNQGRINANLYCVHSITGDVGGLASLARHFGDLKLCGIQVPKERMKDYYAKSIEGIAAEHVQNLIVYQPSGPISLIGWSAGAIIALEMAQQLRSLGREIPFLAALDGAPCNTGSVLHSWDPRYIIRLIINVPRWVRAERASDWTPRMVFRRLDEKIACRFGTESHRLRDSQTLDAATVRNVIRRGGWTAEQKAFVHAVFDAMAAYHPSPYAGRVIAFETSVQPVHRLRQISRAWRAVARHLEVVPVKSNHSGIMSDRIAESIAQKIAKCVSGETASPTIQPS